MPPTASGRREPAFRGRLTSAVALVAAAVLLAACTGSSGAAPPPTTAPTSAVPTPTQTPTTPTASPTPPVTPSKAGYNGATAAPGWLGTRVLAIGPDGYGIAGDTPKELRDRRIVTRDVLAPPADGRFHSSVRTVSSRVAKRSTWSAKCPVTLAQLRYVTVSFRGFDGRAHTGELLVNRSVATGVVTVFRRLFAAGWPIEQMQITTKAELDAPPTGDGNNTGAFACRPVRQATSWSQHAYGLAVDVDPFDNPYVNGDTVLPERARAYTDRARDWPGIVTRNSAVVKAFRSIGWGWGGDYRTKKDWMHFSSTGQ